MTSSNPNCGLDNHYYLHIVGPSKNPGNVSGCQRSCAHGSGSCCDFCCSGVPNKAGYINSTSVCEEGKVVVLIDDKCNENVEQSNPIMNSEIKEDEKLNDNEITNETKVVSRSESQQKTVVTEPILESKQPQTLVLCQCSKPHPCCGEPQTKSTKEQRKDKVQKKKEVKERGGWCCFGGKKQKRNEHVCSDGAHRDIKGGGPCGCTKRENGCHCGVDRCMHCGKPL